MATTRSAFWSLSESTTACTLPTYWEPTNTVPCGPMAIERAFSTFSAKTSARNPAGSTNGGSGDALLTGGRGQAGGQQAGAEHNDEGTRDMVIVLLFSHRRVRPMR